MPLDILDARYYGFDYILQMILSDESLFQLPIVQTTCNNESLFWLAHFSLELVGDDLQIQIP